MSYRTDTLSSPSAPLQSALILGAGTQGLLLARELSAAGISAVVVDQNNAAQPGPQTGASDRDDFELLENAGLETLSGDLGRYEAVIRRGGETIVREVGVVVVAPDPAMEPLTAEWGLKLTGSVVTITEMEATPPQGQRQRVLLLDHPSGTGTPWQTARLLRLARDLQEPGGAQCYLLSPQIKVADHGLERLYRQARDRGVIILRPEKAEVRQDDKGAILTFEDPLLEARLTLRPDLAIVGETDRAPERLAALAGPLGLTMDSYGWLQEDNLLRAPVLTNRLGIFAVGAAAGPLAPAALEGATMAAVEEITRVLRAEAGGSPFPKVDYDQDRCAYCLTCIRLCPHGAISWNNKPLFSPWSCQACGVCVSECPGEALTLAGYGDGANKAVPSPGKNGDPRVVVLCCEKSGFAAYQSLPDSVREELNVRVVAFPCAGNIKLKAMLGAFGAEGGADGVLTLGCHPDNCKSGVGTGYAKRKTGVAADILESVGWERERIRFFALASNMGAKLSKEIAAFKELLSGLDPLPRNV